MAVDALLLLDQVQGESLDKAHPREIEVASYTLGVSNPASPSGGGGLATGKPVFTELNVVAPQSKASITLLDRLLTGQHIAKGVLTLRKLSGSTPVDYASVTLTDVLVTAHDEQSSGDGQVMTSFSLVFAKVQWSYKPQNSDGSLGTAVTTGWDLTTNTRA